MASEEAKEVEIDMTANGGLDWVLHEIAKNLGDISDQLMVANQLKAEEMVRGQRASVDFKYEKGLDVHLVHELLVKHEKLMNDRR